MDSDILRGNMVVGFSIKKIRAKLANEKPIKTAAHMNKIASQPFIGAS